MVMLILLILNYNLNDKYLTHPLYLLKCLIKKINQLSLKKIYIMTSLFTLKFLGWLLSVMVSVMLGKGAVEKIIGSREAVGNFEYMKLSKYRILVGFGELLAIVLFLTPLTSLYGAILIGSFMSAAVALHLSLMGGNKTGIPLIVGILTFIGYLCR